MAKGTKGYYVIKNRDKYIDPNATKLMYRSSWEARFMLYLESQPMVQKWGYECIEVKYLFSADGKVHRYYPDFYVEFSNGKTCIVEIKPAKDGAIPKQSKNKLNYTEGVLTYIKNKDKWEACQRFCESKGWEFKVVTEKDLF